jgi:hypothetical protein
MQKKNLFFFHFRVHGKFGEGKDTIICHHSVRPLYKGVFKEWWQSGG